jgi:thymidylate synthase (FAD)
MKVTLLNYTPLQISAHAIRNCWDSSQKSDSNENILGKDDKSLIYRVGNQFKHSSTLEHIYYNFQIDGVSRAVLQELARHRMTSLSVKSTRYTLKELKNEEKFIDKIKASKYVVFTDNEIINNIIIQQLNNLLLAVQSGASNDIVKYTLPEAYKTSLAWSINLRSLQNFIQLRTHKSALWEIRNLAYEIFENIPCEHKYLLEEFVYKKA